jgi:protocatechuate 3,4-dioxygenase beta subunit
MTHPAQRFALTPLVALIALVALVTALVVAAPLAAQHARPTVAPEDAPSELRMTAAGEPGEALVVDGVVVDDDGKPVPGASLYFFQTGDDGLYGPDDDNRNPRIHGYMRSGADGRFTLHTILPGGYPAGGVAPHIHLYAKAPGPKPEKMKELVFEGDERITPGMRRSSMFTVSPLEEKDGVLHAPWRVVVER